MADRESNEFRGVTPREIELFNDSLERCLSRSGFVDRFYELFLASSEEVREKFRHTDFQKQKRMLKGSLYMIMAAAEDKPEGFVHLERIARVHNRHERNIRPELYDLWLGCLLQTVAEFDPRNSAEIQEVWRRVMLPGIRFMKSRY